MKKFAMTVLLVAVCLVPAVGRTESQEAVLIQHFRNKEAGEFAYAALRGDAANMDKLLASGVNVDCQADNGMTALNLAVRQENRRATQLLLQRKANPNVIDNEDNSPLYLAAGLEDIWYLDILLKNGGNPNLRGKTLASPPIFGAITQQSINNVKLLVKAGAHINEPDGPGGSTPLVAAGRTGADDIALYLLQVGANPLIKDHWGHTIGYYIQHPGGFIPNEHTEKLIELLKEKKVWRKE